MGLLKTIPEFMMGYVMLVLMLFSFSEGAWCSVIGTCACYTSVSVPAIWRGAKREDEMVSQSLKYQDEAYRACSDEVKHFASPAGQHKSGKCPAMSDWKECISKSSDFVRETA